MATLLPYQGIIQGDRLSKLLLYRIGQPESEDASYSIAPSPIVLGLNNPTKYKVAMKMHNSLSCPIQVDDMQLLMCPVYANKKVRYYDGTTLSSIPASNVNVVVRAYTTKLDANNEYAFGLVDTSDEISLSKLSSVNCSHKYVAGETDTSEMFTQFGSHGVYFNDEQKRLNPKVITFHKLVIPEYSDCYLIFEVTSSDNASGGFAVCATDDMRAVNFKSNKSSGVMKRISDVWEPARMYLRENNEWTHQVIPGYVRDILTISYPYTGGQTSGGGSNTPSTTPSVIFDGTKWNITDITSDKVTMDWYGVASKSNNGSSVRVMTNNRQGPLFIIDVTSVSKVKVTAIITASASIDGASSMSLYTTVGTQTAKKGVGVNMGGTLQAGSKSETAIIEVDTSTLTGLQTVTIHIGDYSGTGANLANYSYNCSGNAQVLKIETE